MSETKLAADIEYYQLPKDFASLHNLKDLVEYHQTTIDVQKSLLKYQENLLKYTVEFFNSFRMNVDEVLNFIPESENYQVCLQGNSIQDYKKYTSSDYIPKKHSISEALRLASTDQKIFLVDTINKKIEICYWLFEKDTKYVSQAQYNYYRSRGMEPPEIPEPQSKRDFKQRRLDDITTNIFDEYKNSRYEDHSFQILKDSILQIYVPFYRTYRQYQTLNNGFGSRMANVSCSGHDIHHICMRTNKYLGFQSKLSEYAEEDNRKTTYYK